MPARPRAIRGYGYWLVYRVVLETGLLVALIEGVFLGEKLAGILERTLGIRMSAGQVTLTLATTAPEIFDLALPMSLLIAVCRVTMTLRQDRELVALATAGVSTSSLVRLFASLGVPAALLSLLVLGVVAPYARFAQRVISFDAAYMALQNGDLRSELVLPDGYTVLFGTHDADPATAKRIFIHHRESKETDRLTVANDARLVPDRDGWFKLKLKESSAFDFASAAWLMNTDLKSVATRVAEGIRESQASGYTRDLPLNKVLRFAPRTRPSELTLFELASRGEFREAAMRVSRSMLCLLAPFIALFAASLTGSIAGFLVLPAAAGLLMVFEVAIAAIQTSLPAAWAVQGLFVAAVYAGTIALLFWLTLRRQSWLVADLRNGR